MMIVKSQAKKTLMPMPSAGGNSPSEAMNATTDQNMQKAKMENCRTYHMLDSDHDWRQAVNLGGVI
jgi:hypothetical protein